MLLASVAVVSTVTLRPLVLAALSPLIVTKVRTLDDDGLPEPAYSLFEDVPNVATRRYVGICGSPASCGRLAGQIFTSNRSPQ